MYSQTTIANMALAYLGQPSITSLRQDNEQARWLSLFYEPVREEVLRTHDWAFATVEKPLVPVVQANGTGLILYNYPADALFIRAVYQPQQRYNLAPFSERFEPTLHSRVLATTLPDAWVRYTRKITDETQYDPAFVKCFALALACDAALALTGDVNLSARLQQKYTLYLEEARRTNMAEGHFVCPQTDAFSEVR